jgi:hypothetical protein
MMRHKLTYNCMTKLYQRGGSIKHYLFLQRDGERFCLTLILLYKKRIPLIYNKNRAKGYTTISQLLRVCLVTRIHIALY